MTKIAVIIPAFNEQDSIAKVVEEVNNISSLVEIIPIVINDCSTDNTKNIISTLKCVAINLPVNLGIGGAVQTGFKYALKNNFDYAVQVDGDGQHPPIEIIKMLERATSNNSDIVIGSRFIDNKGFQSSFTRRMGINYFSWLNNFLVSVRVYDSTSGFRMLNKKALKIVCEYYPDEYPEPEAIILYAFHNLKITEVAVNMRERQGGVSSINSFSAFYYMFKVTLAIFFTFIRLQFKTK